MAMQDPILFTGKELNFEIPEFKELKGAEQRLRDKLQDREDKQEKIQDELRKGMNVDLETFVSNYAQKDQDELSKAFVDKWTQRLKERGGKFTNDDLVEQSQEKFAIQQKQNKWLSSQKVWDEHNRIVKADPTNYDVPKFAEATKNFMMTGEYDPKSLEFSALNPAGFLRQENWMGKDYTETEVSREYRDGYWHTKTKVRNASDEEAIQHALDIMVNDATGRTIKWAMQTFMNADDKTKQEYLKSYDVDKSGGVSDADVNAFSATVNSGMPNIRENPILKYAAQQLSKDVVNERVVSNKFRGTNPDSGGGGTKAPAAKFTQNIDLPDGSKGSITYTGAEAQAKFAEAEAERKKQEAANALTQDRIPWGEEDDKYEIPSKSMATIPVKKDGEYKGYNFLVGEPRKWGLKDKKDPEAVFNMYDPDRKAFLFSYGGKTYAYTADQLPEATRKYLYQLKVKTSAGTKTIEELERGVTNTPTESTKPKLY